MYRGLCLVGRERGMWVWLLVWALALQGCDTCSGDTTIKRFECESSRQCKKSEVCQNGRCTFLDKDKDGWAPGKDCDDSSARIYPGGPEYCDNNLDDNCNGKVDERPCLCVDGEKKECGSNFGICKKGFYVCEEGKWSTVCEGEIGPEKEICDGVDNDCNGKTDENCECINGKKEDCYEGPAGTAEKGICKKGKRTCVQGRWGPCQDQVKPQGESCDGVDNDCDGIVDNHYPQEGLSCSSSKPGECAKGTYACKEGKLVCQPSPPKAEICDGVDNDCNGKVDESFPEQKAPCKTQKPGICAQGTALCQKGTLVCQPPPAQKEVCDNKDNNCDGKVDEGLTQSCYSGPQGTRGVGSCQEGQILCLQGKFTSCQGQVVPAKEVCHNKKDDDCDGTTDEQIGRALKFSGGTNRLEVAHDSVFDLRGNFTLELWFYLDGMGTRGVALLLNKHLGNSNTNGYHLKIQGPGTQCAFSWWDAQGGKQILLGACPVKKWTHIALVYDATKTRYRFYLNGTKAAEGVQTITPLANTYPLLFATETSPVGDPNFRGQLASIRLSKSARYPKDFTPTCTFKTDADTVGLWNLDEGGGTVARDLSGANRHGKIVGATWVAGRSCNASKAGGCIP